ncbi:MAG TPA: hypothetical protein VLK30_07530 [Candidatus Limnocylindrales bacterium]|nr:hypothetical protein [Candidatus Limnocylindrales bacterium]
MLLDVVAALVELAGAEEPGIVAALTAPKTPTPAIAPSAAPMVRRFKLRIAESRPLVLASICPLLFITVKCVGPG